MNKISLFIILVLLIILGFRTGYFDNLIQRISPPEEPETEIIYREREEIERIEIINKEEAKPEDLDFSIFWEVWNKLEEKHIDLKKEDLRREMLEGAIRGMVETIQDEHTEFLNPEEADEFLRGMEEEFEGVGMHITIEGGQLKVIAPIKETPAYRAGILPGDKIMKINDISTQGITLSRAVTLIRGPRGTEVRLLILRDDKEIEKRIIRGLIIVPTTKLDFLEGGTIAHIQIFNFGKGTFDQMKEIANRIKKSDATKIILDLRGNPGGWLDSAIDVAGLFLDRNSIVVIQEKRDREVISRTERDPVLKGYDIVVLVNRGTASGAEILAGALRDHRKAKLLIGETTVGKGSVQELKRLADNSILKVTVAYWLTPNRHRIEDRGLTPDIEVINRIEEIILGIDSQLQRAIEELKN